MSEKAVRSPAEMVAIYIQLRDHKKAADEEFKKSMARVEQGLAKLEAEMLAHLHTTGTNSLACDSGTVYKIRHMSVTIEKNTTFLDYVRAHELWDALDVKANKTFVKAMMEEGPDSIPPGLKITQVDVVGVRRS